MSQIWHIVLNWLLTIIATTQATFENVQKLCVVQCVYQITSMNDTKNPDEKIDFIFICSEVTARTR